MADKTVIVKIEYDTEAAIKSINELTSTVEGQKVAQAKLKYELEAGTISQKEYSIALEKSKQITSAANTERKTTLQLISAEKGSVNELKANIKLLTAERDKLNQSTSDGRKAAGEYNTKINEMKAALKGAQSETGKTQGAFAAFGNSLKAIPGPIGGVISGIMGITRAGLAFIATPIGAVIAAIGLALGALMKYFKGSEEGQNRLNKVTNIAKGIWEAFMNIIEKVGKIIFDAVSKPKETIISLGNLIKENLINRFKAFGEIGKAIVKIFKGDFKEGFKQLAEGGIQAVTGVTNAFDKLANVANKVRDGLKGIIEDTKKNIEMSNRLSDVQAAINKRERALIVERQKTRVAVDELLLKSKQDDIFTEEQRLEMLKEASKQIDTLATKEEGLAAMRLEAARLNLKIAGDDKEALNAVAQAEADLISAKAEGLEARRKIEGQISDLNVKATKETETRTEKEIEIDTSASDEILRRRGEAIMKLAELKQRELEENAEGLQAERDAQISAADAEKERKLEEQGILQEEIELAEFEHKARLAEINQAYEEQIRAQHAETLADAQASMQAIIDAAQGMADSRVTIMSTAFSKIATINWKEVKTAQDAFLAIGSAAKGLTDLLVKNYDEDFANLAAQKESELALVGDNKEAQDQINKSFAKKENELKKKQFEDDKKKALIDAAIATALSVVKMLSAGFPIGIVMAALAAVLGGIQIAAIAKQQYTPSFAKGGIIGGKSHAEGGTKFWGQDGSMFEAEKGEAMFVMKKDATAEIAALSMINESHGGRSWTGKPSSHLQEGGEATGGDVTKMVDDAIARTPIFVRVGDIQTGMTDVEKSKGVGVI